MSRNLVTFACLALLVTVGYGKDEVKDIETKKVHKPTVFRIVKPAVNAPAVVETETVQTRKSDGTAAAIGSGTNATYYCYQCNSATMGEEDCDSADSEALSKFNKPCTGVPKGSSIVGVTTAVQCRKIQQEVEGEQKRIIRECAYTGDEELDGKKRTGNKGVYMYFYTCINSMANEPCNTATTQTVLSLGAFIGIAIAQFLQLF